ncbi:bacillithiol biosynthesis cysteine-adding enzyme BshC [Chryseomicrobium excrementi]|uniref:Putative cysteine ligase BshC n=1 Tax=Chryseomicrobium excrementi TaxID=2041346 RepID=A0A2M9F3B5_9BACL|nr:bacillithiol biosynthesis cysteine-adding enzyme BshC [Chryseomicrobium excrementi]PJK17953.1 bacillithiol biosynthesis cysteine-adding enzyme BshC [Chryseomicrobium excrementi]
MKVSTHPQPKASAFYSTYIDRFEEVEDYFYYSWKPGSWKTRTEELVYPTSRRVRLVETIKSSMGQVELSELQQQHLRELEKGADVTITGQQTGILTGPIYSIHKAITAIVLAKQITEATGKKVVPVFWMAGEDHDILEVNHFYIEKNREVSKLSLSVERLSTEMVADQEIPVSEFRGLLHQAFRDLPETEHTQSLWKMIESSLERQGTYKGFFLELFQQFFHKEGLLFVNSSDTAMRELAKEFTKQLIRNNEALRHSVYEKEQQLAASGFGFPVQCRLENAHLFYVEDNHRYLLEATDAGFENKDLKKSWTMEELLEEVEQNPACISHNVVTRPLVQQYLFPVHTFVGGPGEIAYWALLKDAFAVMNLKMPIVAPRFSVTILPLTIEEKMKQTGLSLEAVWGGETAGRLQAYIDSQKNTQLSKEIEELYTLLTNHYAKLSDTLNQEGFKLEPLLEKNQHLHRQQVTFLDHAIEDLYFRRFDAAVASYKAIQNELVPLDSLQERIYSPLHYLNKYGTTIVEQLLEIPYELDGKHVVVHTS